MSNLPALRRMALSSAKCCSAIHRRARGTDSGIAEILDSETALTAIIATAFKIKTSHVRRLIEPCNDPAPSEPTLADYEHVRFRTKHG